MRSESWLALSAGGARGLAHLGVLERCREEGIGIAGIVGSSMGAIAGAAWCSGADLAEVCARLQALRIRHFIRPRLTRGWVSLDPLRRILREVLPVSTFEELSTPLVVICTDLKTGEPIKVNKGSLVDAVVASGTFAGICEPIRIEGGFLVDGGYSAPLPVSHCPSGSHVIAVDTNVVPLVDHGPFSVKRGGLHPFRLGGLFQHTTWSFDALFHVAARSFSGSNPDVLIEPQLEGMSFLDFRRGIWAMAQGRAAVESAASRIFSSLASGL